MSASRSGTRICFRVDKRDEGVSEWVAPEVDVVSGVKMLPLEGAWAMFSHFPCVREWVDNLQSIIRDTRLFKLKT